MIDANIHVCSNVQTFANVGFYWHRLKILMKNEVKLLPRARLTSRVQKLETKPDPIMPIKKR
jgi:hypothetical protein